MQKIIVVIFLILLIPLLITFGWLGNKTVTVLAVPSLVFWLILLAGALLGYLLSKYFH